MSKNTSRWIWIPSAVTSLRLLLAAPILIFCLQQEWGWVFWFYIAALSTDFFDGLLARKFHWETKAGAELDGWSDLTLATAAFLGITLGGASPLLLLVSTGAVGVINHFIRWRADQLPTVAKFSPVMEVSGLFLGIVYLSWSFATLAYGWAWWYIPFTFAILIILGILKRGRIKAWCTPFMK
jgi:phosphatidylglycerophosphate synthase